MWVIGQLLQQMENKGVGSRGAVAKERLRTICTSSDTFDVNQSEQSKENKNRHNTLTHTQSSYYKPTRQHSKRHHDSQCSGATPQHARQRTSISKVKAKRQSSQCTGGRLLTEYSDEGAPMPAALLMAELKKKLVFPVYNYRVEAFRVLRLVYSEKTQEFFSAKMGSSSRKYTLVKLKEGSAGRLSSQKYEREKEQFGTALQGLAKKEKEMFLKVHQVWKENKNWVVVTDHYLNPRWNNDHFYLFLNTFKNNEGALSLLLQQLAASAMLLSRTGRAHSSLTIESVYFPLLKGQLQAQGLVKLGCLSSVLKVKNKKDLVGMPISLHTPPEVLNFILFEANEAFDRSSLEHISDLTQGWQVSLWSLGVLALELLNGGPLVGEGMDCASLLVLQRQLLVRYSYLLDRVSQTMRACLSRMLALWPKGRPHPHEILCALSPS